MTRKLFVIAALAALGIFVTNVAYAQGECSGGVCGTPQQSGGGGCGCGGGSILINNTDEGDTYQYADDYDDDGREDNFDNCPFVANKGQLDTDGDGVGDLCDICPNKSDKEQLDTDGDGIGDACDDDQDGDGIANAEDNCAKIANLEQVDTDGDQLGNACDEDDDGDGVKDPEDVCPLRKDNDTTKQDCNGDEDGDGLPDKSDFCPTVPSPSNADIDGDKLGDECDPDRDGDGVFDNVDNCLDKPNADQRDADRDGKGDTCDQTFCFVVDGDEQNCLDPNRTFMVYSPMSHVRTGEPFRLRLFANRENAPIKYQWVVTKRPSGSNATVENPQGTVRVSTAAYEYRYQKNNIARFEADEPGEYQLKVVASLVFPDVAKGDFSKDSSFVMTMVAEGDSVGGCSMGQRGSSQVAGFVVAGLLLVLGLVVKRRKR